MVIRRKWGLALGGGFLRGAAHIGVLKVLNEEGFLPDVVAGASAGSIVAALYCSGCSLERLEKVTRELGPECFYDPFSTVGKLSALIIKLIFDIIHVPAPFQAPLGLASGKKMERWLDSQLVPKHFRELKTFLAVTSVDINTGTRVVFTDMDVYSPKLPEDIIFIQGYPVTSAVVASCAVPGIFEPKKIGIRLLVDGGLKENVPVETLSLLGVEVVVGVDVGYDGEPYKDIFSIVQLLSQSLDIIGSEVTKMKLDRFANLVIRPVIKDVGPWDFSKIPYCIKQGEEAARQALPALREFLQKSI